MQAEYCCLHFDKAIMFRRMCQHHPNNLNTGIYITFLYVILVAPVVRHLLSFPVVDCCKYIRVSLYRHI